MSDNILTLHAIVQSKLKEKNIIIDNKIINYMYLEQILVFTLYNLHNIDDNTFRYPFEGYSLIYADNITNDEIVNLLDHIYKHCGIV